MSDRIRGGVAVIMLPSDEEAFRIEREDTLKHWADDFPGSVPMFWDCPCGTCGNYVAYARAQDPGGSGRTALWLLSSWIPASLKMKIQFVGLEDEQELDRLLDICSSLRNFVLDDARLASLKAALRPHFPGSHGVGAA